MLDHQLSDILADGAFSPDTLRTLARLRRKQAEAAIEILIEALDALDGDPEVEPTLGSPEGWMGTSSLGGSCVVTVGTLDQRRWAAGKRSPKFDDCEPVCEDEGACIQSQPHDEEPDNEPSLAALDSRLDQRDWAGRPNEQSCEEQDGWRRPVKRRKRYTEDPKSVARRAGRNLAEMLGQPAAPPPSTLRVIGFAD
ncbi:hypothetical protein [Lichenifustis flavocetrariae]|uniref:Uncharacterized protein n=1 Tax=Lichenifustis flavocetrariae TaxID=2949735 RepID=A0AA41YU45_9HYPH|nr:hypothetical protein [Lichenifustis flavocetrariae]MCW6506883.1 hypothetical protein [Lichenifustis flavocetrariae]